MFLFGWKKKYLLATERIEDLENELKVKSERLKKLERFSEMEDYQKELEDTKKQIIAAISKSNSLKIEETSYLEKIKVLEKEFGSLNELKELSEFGYYKRAFDFSDSEKYKEVIKRNSDEQKDMIKSGEACICTTSWNIDGDVKAGEKMTNQSIKLMLRAFNGECDATIKNLTYRNYDASLNRIEKAYKAINKLGEINRIHITENFFGLKIKELKLVFEKNELIEEEKEMAREHAELMREQKRAEIENEKALKEAEKEKKKYNEMINKLRKEMEESKDEEIDGLNSTILKLEEKLRELAEKERKISQAQLTKAGYVYIISNIGAFGQDVYKIGLTRRLEPLDRVKELSSASVPFRFDCHGMIWSEDAVELEKYLHNKFDKYRVNKANLRKEFFRMPWEEIEGAVKEIDKDLELRPIAVAEEYYKTLNYIEDDEYRLQQIS